MTETTSIIDQILTDDCQNETIYHYTSSEGLLGIIGTKTIRFTQSYYLNDFEENLNGWKIFLRAFEKFEKEEPSCTYFKDAIKHYFKDWLTLDLEDLSSEVFKLIRIRDYRSFVFSTSYKFDDLNQWRSYTPKSSGFSIGIKVGDLFKRCQDLFRDHNPEIEINPNNCKILIKNCIYDDALKAAKCNELLNFHYYQFLKSNGGSFWINTLFFDILSLNLFFKNHNFADEHECRIVVLPMGDKLYDLQSKDVDVLKFRSSNNMIVPYVELKLPIDLIKCIVIGPTPHKYHSKDSIEMLMSTQNLANKITVSNSKIPFRTW